MAECVRVSVRCRPLNSKEKADNRKVIVEVDSKTGGVQLHNPQSNEPPKSFTFDLAFDWNVTQKEVYDHVARPVVLSCMEGYNGTIFAYGQTGTGKTHTMEGVIGGPTELQGIIPNCFDHIFEAVNASAGKQWMVRASYLEIYNEEVRDLLSKDPKNKLELKEHKDSGVYVKGLNAFVVKGVPELRNVLEVRMLRARCVHAATCMCCWKSDTHKAHTCDPTRACTLTCTSNCTVACVATAAYAHDCMSQKPHACIWTNLARAGRQEEPLHRGHADEPGLVALALHLHHHN